MDKLKKIYLASPRGFCAGVKRATSIVNLLLEKYGSPIYVKHQIVHNRHVVSDFEKKGIIFVEKVDEIPNGKIAVFSAHGSPPSDYVKAKLKNLRVFDAVCPLVTKVHLEAKKYEKEGYFIFYIGHKGHPEPDGVLGEVSSKSVALIETIEESQEIKSPQKEKLVVLTQTTLSFDDTKEIIANLKLRFPKLEFPQASDICYATQNRQNAVKELAKKSDLILVIGSKESSNSNRLKDVAKKEGKAAYLINDISEIEKSWLENITNLGITAGASVPQNIIDEVVESLSQDNVEIRELQTIKENVYFPLPYKI